MVLNDPVPLDVLDAGGKPVRVKGRGEVSAPPLTVVGPHGVDHVTGWAGPWPADARRADAAAAHRRARPQVPGASGAAPLPLGGLLRRAGIRAPEVRFLGGLASALAALVAQTAPAVVAVHTRRGRLERRVGDPLGDPGNPRDVAQLEAKFRRLTDGVWPSDQAQRAASAALAPDNGSIADPLASLSRGA